MKLPPVVIRVILFCLRQLQCYSPKPQIQLLNRSAAAPQCATTEHQISITDRTRLTRIPSIPYGNALYATP